MFERIKATGNWIWNHKLAIGIGSAVVGGATYYGIQKLSGYVQDQLSYQLLSQLQQGKKDSFFSSIEYQQTILREIEALRINLDNCIPFPSQEEIALSTKSATKEEKVAYWNNLKDLNITRLCLTVYCEILFSISMRLHLTIVARYIYLANDSEDPELASMFSLDDKTQLAFLNQSKYIIESGVNHLRNYIEAYVHDILSEWSIVTPCSHEDFSKIISTIRKSIETSEGVRSVLINFVLPPEEDDNSNPSLKKLQNEIRNTFETKEFTEILHNCLDTGFYQLLTTIGYVYANKKAQIEPQSPDFRIHIAKLIPLIEHTTSSLLNPQNEILLDSLNNENLENLSRTLFDMSP